MKKIFFFCAVCLFATSGCVKNESPGSPEPEPEKEYNLFSFSTTAKTNVNIRYQDMGGVVAPVYFEIYDTCPVRENDSKSGYVKIDGIEPLYADVTAENGSFTGMVEFPAYLKKVYIYSPSFYARTLMEGTVAAGTLTVSDYVAEEAAASAPLAFAAASYDSDAVKTDGWKTYLGNYDPTYGRIDYKYTGSLKPGNISALYTAHASVINVNKPCPAEYRSSSDLRIDKTAEVVVTFLGGNTCWNSSMGYYFYKDGQKPKSLAEANVIMIFPNTQDGQWSNNTSLARNYKGVDRGTAVQLMYYPDINNKNTGTTVFPANYRIGFVLACNGWQNRLPGFTSTKKYRSATSDGLSVNNQGVSYPGPRTAVYHYKNASKDIDAVMFSFEDHVDDENFSDVVFTLVSNPVDAVVDIPSVDQDGENQTIKTLKGMYAFEDLWPSRGDYDMNDVMVKADYEKTFNNKGISAESFTFKPFSYLSGLKNGFAITLGGNAASATIEVATKQNNETEYRKAQVTRDGNVLLLTDNVSASNGASYKITATYPAPVKESGTAVPFIYSTTRTDLDKNNNILHEVPSGLRWEVHLPFEAPSAHVDPYFFGKGDDCSIPEKNIFYVRSEIYPFAFFLAGATDKDLSKLLDPANEKQPIDELYPDYSGWVKSQGATNKDWYKK